MPARSSAQRNRRSTPPLNRVPCSPWPYCVIADHVRAGTFLVAGAITGGHVRVRQACPQHLEAVLVKLRDAGARVWTGPDWIEIDMSGRPGAVDVSTMPYPGFPTDMQAQFAALDCIATGVATISENVFENRFMHVGELARMGARIELHGHEALILGPSPLSGAKVMATDLRASACLVIAALAAEGESVIDRVYHLDRGYERLEEKLRALGADVSRVG